MIKVIGSSDTVHLFQLSKPIRTIFQFRLKCLNPKPIFADFALNLSISEVFCTVQVRYEFENYLTVSWSIWNRKLPPVSP